MPHGGDIYRNKVNIDFSVNLSPIPLPESIREAMLTGLDKAGYYPDPEQTEVRRALSEQDRVDALNIYAGSGASELIMACVRSAAPERVLLAAPCYTGYLHALNSLQTAGHGASLDSAGLPDISCCMLREEDQFRLTPEILRYMDDSIDLMFLTDPWNPTGANIPDDLLYQILDRALEKGIRVVLDQSFLPMSDKITRMQGDEAGELIKRYDNLYIIRSFTKLFALPGIRMGYLISSENNISMIRRQLPEWNLSSVAAEVMTACAKVICSTTYIQDCLSVIRTGRAYLTGELRQLGFRVYDSDSAFILFRSEHELYNELLRHGILIRDCSDYKGLGRGYYRIAVREQEACIELIDGLRKHNGNRIC